MDRPVVRRAILSHLNDEHPAARPALGSARYPCSDSRRVRRRRIATGSLGRGFIHRERGGD